MSPRPGRLRAYLPAALFVLASALAAFGWHVQTEHRTSTCGGWSNARWSDPYHDCLRERPED